MASISDIIQRLLASSMDRIPHYLLLRDVVGEDKYSEKMQQLKAEILRSHWVLKVVEEQWEDGSWGRFHSLSSSDQAHFTTEQALRRLFHLGLDSHDAPIHKALAYLNAYLQRKIELRDRVEKKHDWGLLTRLFVITWMRIFQVPNPVADAEAQKWAQVVTEAFCGGSFDAKIYRQAYIELLQPEAGKTIWDIQNFYMVALLPNLLNETSEERFLEFIMNAEQGMYYICDGPLNQCPSIENPRQVNRFLMAHEWLSYYRLYSQKAGFFKKWLWSWQGEDGFWDLGAQAKDGICMPLSSSWRKAIDRKLDYSIRALRLLKRMELPVFNRR